MNPIVLICTDNRVEITSTNIQALMLQSVVPKIVLVCSKRSERDYFLYKFPELTIVALRNNHPLGKKFQDGVDLIRKLNPNPLIITGSDDILGADFIKKACALVESGEHFIGLKQWYIYHNEILHLYHYNSPIPLGTRAYSLEMLNAISWKVFDTGKDRLLDDLGFHSAKKTGLKMKIINNIQKEKLNVVSVKGNWPMLNPYEKMINHPNCTLIRSYNDTKGIL